MSLRILPSVLVVAVILIVGACTATPGASAPSSASTPAPTAKPTPTLAASASAPAGATTAAVTQTDTAWGRIWDALPPSFPQFPGSQPAQTRAGPASAVVQIPTRVDIAADWFGMSLEAAGFTIAAANGPLEDGSFVIDATGPGSCRAQVSIAPLGGVTIATIFVGSDCPFS